MRRVLSVLSIALSFFSTGIAAQENANAAVLDRTITVHFEDRPLIYLLANLAADFKIPVGYERAPDEKDQARININMKGGTIRELLDSLTTQEPAYRWELRDGVVNFTPTHDRVRFLAAFLDTHVSEFTPGKDLDRYELRDRILALPEVSSVMAAYGIRPDPIPGEPSGNEDLKATRVSNFFISDTTVRTILNRIVRESGNRAWSVAVSKGRQETITLNL